MNIVQINGGAVGSTGKIMFGISTVCTDEKQKTLCAAPEVSSGNKTGRNLYIIQNNNHRKINVLLDRITGRHNMHSKIATERLLKVISGFKPDIIQLHNLHEAYINLPMLFKKHRKIYIRFMQIVKLNYIRFKTGYNLQKPFGCNFRVHIMSASYSVKQNIYFSVIIILNYI